MYVCKHSTQATGALVWRRTRLSARLCIVFPATIPSLIVARLTCHRAPSYLFVSNQLPSPISVASILLVFLSDACDFLGNGMQLWELKPCDRAVTWKSAAGRCRLQGRPARGAILPNPVSLPITHLGTVVFPSLRSHTRLCYPCLYLPPERSLAGLWNFSHFCWHPGPEAILQTLDIATTIVSRLAAGRGTLHMPAAPGQGAWTAADLEAAERE